MKGNEPYIIFGITYTLGYACAVVGRKCPKRYQKIIFTWVAILLYSLAIGTLLKGIL